MKLLSLISLFLISTSVLAENAQRRVCRISGGQFLGLDIQKPQKDNIGVCFFSQMSQLGTISLIENLHNGTDSMAVNALKTTKQTKVMTCEEVGSFETVALTSTGESYSLCYFEDYSFIGLETLKLGWFSPFNQRLRSLL